MAIQQCDSVEDSPFYFALGILRFEISVTIYVPSSLSKCLSQDSLSSIDPRIDLTWSFHDQSHMAQSRPDGGFWSVFLPQIICYGDPARSGINTRASRINYLIQTASSIDGPSRFVFPTLYQLLNSLVMSELASAQGIVSSSSWLQGTEFYRLVAQAGHPAIFIFEIFPHPVAPVNASFERSIFLDWICARKSWG